MHAATEDEVLKNTYADLAFENFEIASYKSLITMAEAAGEPEIATACRNTLAEEQAMADWLDSHVVPITQAYLAHVATGTKGDR